VQTLTLGDESFRIMIDIEQDRPPALSAVERSGHRWESIRARPLRLASV